MSLPKGAIWQHLRQQLLSSIPVGSRLTYRSPSTLAHWQGTGTYVVSKVSSKQFTVVGASVDVAGALLGEAEHFLDHAAEHQAHLCNEIRSNGWTSVAWQVTGIYYWAYFLCMAITRMLGDTVWFVDSTVADQLSKLALTGSARLGAGTFRVICGPSLSATDREILLRKSPGRLHEQLWRTYSSIVDSLVSSVPPGTTDPIEERLFLAQQRAAQLLGSDWPSALRNVVNYRPGFGYATVRRANVLESFRYIDVSNAYDSRVLIDQFEASVVGLQRAKVDEQPKLATRVLVGLTFILHGIARELHRELLERHGLDQRWTNDRSRFIRDRGLVFEGAEWPC